MIATSFTCMYSREAYMWERESRTAAPRWSSAAAARKARLSVYSVNKRILANFRRQTSGTTANSSFVWLKATWFC